MFMDSYLLCFDTFLTLPRLESLDPKLNLGAAAQRKGFRVYGVVKDLRLLLQLKT